MEKAKTNRKVAKLVGWRERWREEEDGAQLLDRNVRRPKRAQEPKMRTCGSNHNDVALQFRARSSGLAHVKHFHLVNGRRRVDEQMAD